MVLIFFGTRVHDSRSEVPRVFAVQEGTKTSGIPRTVFFVWNAQVAHSQNHGSITTNPTTVSPPSTTELPQQHHHRSSNNNVSVDPLCGDHSFPLPRLTFSGIPRCATWGTPTKLGRPSGELFRRWVNAIVSSPMMAAQTAVPLKRRSGKLFRRWFNAIVSSLMMAEQSAVPLTRRSGERCRRSFNTIMSLPFSDDYHMIKLNKRGVG